MKDLLIRGGQLVDTEKDELIYIDILVHDGIIEKIAPNIQQEVRQEIDAKGLYIAPGLIDLHVHLRDPGQTYKEDIKTGTKAAAYGGVTTMLCMPNTSPALDNPETLSYVLEKGKASRLRVLPVCAITKGLSGEALVDFDTLHEMGAIGFSDDGVPVSTAKFMRKAMQKAKELNTTIFAHCEDLSLADGGIINEGTISQTLNVKGISNASEDVGTAREIMLAKDTGAKLHVCHVSTKSSVDMIRIAKQQGVNVTAETAPHYFTFTEDELLKRDANFRMNPPLRTNEDKKAIIEGLIDGTLDAIATDHAPHSAEEKADFNKAPNGIVGMATSFAVSMTKLVHGKYITIFDLIRLMAENPGKIINKNTGKIAVGTFADIMLFNPNEEWAVDDTTYLGKSRNTPFMHMPLKGKVKYTICSGKLVFKDTNL